MSISLTSATLAHEGWAALQIVFVNVLLGGDNAIAIAMACRSLPPKQQRLGILLGTGLGIVLRIVLIGIIGRLLAIPFMHVIAAALLIWIGIQLVRPGEDDPSVSQATALWRAVMAILWADLAMSLDNALATAAVAQSLPEDSRLVIVFVGLALGAPVIAFGSQLVLTLLERFPALVYAGAAVLGWIAGELLLADPTVGGTLHQWLAVIPGISPAIVSTFTCIGAAILVPLLGRVMVHHNRAG
ncbi:integral membrane, YjbE family protein [Paraburkholderia xenovorans LB400]|uniref:Integral membrane protein TerC n=1 Tax=Paraburkholderia xenovorans (strain LB400) TaxID=266265 RepID=Q13XP3_PARXL|nr:YjbE family putative metal transport protein [Paraburkholderia xenovorans]ABE31146.1 Integral membrane protein TerC [Paraburkholderia xenovorans LB400]AIP30594.1 integral membrane, YjbE family protein [Paraburkholderia xenovorans LB400]